MKPEEKQPSCDNCKFWYRHLDKKDYPQQHGDCRRCPPDIAPSFWVMLFTDWWVGFWPETKHADWCGEFEAKPVPNLK